MHDMLFVTDRMHGLRGLPPGVEWALQPGQCLDPGEESCTSNEVPLFPFQNSKVLADCFFLHIRSTFLYFLSLEHAMF